MMNGIPEIKSATKIFDTSLFKGTRLPFFKCNSIFFIACAQGELFIDASI
ncbi:hypothetical protein V1502_03280 [Bacillus sp. SCS-153A]